MSVSAPGPPFIVRRRAYGPPVPSPPALVNVSAPGPPSATKSWKKGATRVMSASGTGSSVFTLTPFTPAALVPNTYRSASPSPSRRTTSLRMPPVFATVVSISGTAPSPSGLKPGTNVSGSTRIRSEIPPLLL